MSHCLFFRTVRTIRIIRTIRTIKTITKSGITLRLRSFVLSALTFLILNPLFVILSAKRKISRIALPILHPERCFTTFRMTHSTTRVYKSIPTTFISPCSSGNTLVMRVYKSIPTTFTQPFSSKDTSHHTGI